MPESRSNIEFIIPTFNEEKNLPHALKCICEWADAVHVADSESTDRTREVAETHCANVVFQPWLRHARQKNWAIDKQPLKADGIVIFDADELIPPSCVMNHLRFLPDLSKRFPKTVVTSTAVSSSLNGASGIAVTTQAGIYSIFIRGKARYGEREVHEHMITSSKTCYPFGHMEHNDDRHDLDM